VFAGPRARGRPAFQRHRPAADGQLGHGRLRRCALADVPTAGTRLPVSQRIPAGSVGHELAARHRGAHLHRRAAAAGRRHRGDAGAVRARRRRGGDQHVPRRGEAVRRMGEDIRRGAACCRRHASLAAGGRRSPPRSGWRRLPVHWRREGGGLLHRLRTVMPGEPLPPGGIYNSNRYSAARPARRARLRGRGSWHRARPPRRHARGAAPRRRGPRPHPHQRRRVGGRGGPRQAGGRGRGQRSTCGRSP
jgi:hypothetical protein